MNAAAKLRALGGTLTMPRLAQGGQGLRELRYACRILATIALGGCAGGAREVRKCERPPEVPQPLDLTRAADRTHLRHDAESAETIAIHYSDVSPARREGEAEYTRARDECMDSLFAAVARTHGLDTARVRAYTIVRDPWFDAAVLVSFAALYALSIFALAGGIVRGWATDDWPIAALWLLGLSCGATLLALMVFDVWATMAESLRLGSWHLSYRAERLPWLHHRGLFLTGSLVLFWLMALARYRVRHRWPRRAA